MEAMLNELEEHKQQLAQVAEALQASPGDAELQRLKADLEQVVSLTMDLIQKQSGGASGSAEGSGSGGGGSGGFPSGLVPPPLPDVASYPEAADILAAQQKYQEELRMRWSTGDRCMAPWEDGKHYVAKLEEVFDPQPGGFDCTVLYLEFGNTASCSLAHLQPYASAPATALSIGARVKAVWPGEGLFVDGLIEKGTDHKDVYVVNFTGKKNKKKNKRLVEVHVRDIILRTGESKMEALFAANSEEKGAAGEEDGTGTGTAAPATAASTGITPDQLPDKPVIPDKLEIKATDTDAQKKIKQKKIKRIKSTHAMKKREAEQNARKNTWLDFQNSKSQQAGSKASIHKGKKRKSIWATPDVTTGTEGVTSAYKMTKFADRGRHVFEQMPTSHLPPPSGLDGPPGPGEN